MQEKGFVGLINKHLNMILSIIALITIFVSLAVTATDIKNEVDYQGNKIKEIDNTLAQNVKSVNEINVKLSSIDAKLDYLVEENKKEE